VSHDDLPIGRPVAIEAENTQAEQIGPGTVAIVAELSAVNAIHRLRAIQGMIRAAQQIRRHPPGRGVRPLTGSR